MRIADAKLLAALAALDVQHLAGASLAQRTSLGIGGTTDVLLVRRHASLPDLVALLDAAGIPHRFLGGGSNEGLIGVTYEIVGTPGQPVLRVNPISAMAPGVLRKIFEFGTGKPNTRNSGTGGAAAR